MPKPKKAARGKHRWVAFRVEKIINRTKLIAIANKEAIICGWPLIKKELKKNKLKICSISLDLIMDNPLHAINKDDVEWLAKELKKVIDYFSINGEAKELEVVLNKGNGTVKINSIHVEDDKWKGIYIENIPIEIEAIPEEGYAFVKWKNRKLSKKLLSEARSMNSKVIKLKNEWRDTRKLIKKANKAHNKKN